MEGPAARTQLDKQGTATTTLPAGTAPGVPDHGLEHNSEQLRGFSARSCCDLCTDLIPKEPAESSPGAEGGCMQWRSRALAAAVLHPTFPPLLHSNLDKGRKIYTV